LRPKVISRAVSSTKTRTDNIRMSSGCPGCSLARLCWPFCCRAWACLPLL